MHRTWWTTESHRELSGFALALGPYLIVEAKRSREPGRITTEAGKPLSISVIAREMRFPEAELAQGVEELIAVGTLQRDADGVLWFPGFERWQEGGSAGRMRRHRARHSDAHGDAHCDVSPLTSVPSRASDPDLSGEVSEGGGPVVEVEVEVEGVELAELAESAIPAHKATLERLIRPLSSAVDESAFRSIKAVVDGYRFHHGDTFRQPPTADSPEVKAIAARLAEGFTVRELIEAIDGAHLSPFHSGANPNGAKFLRLTTILGSSSAVSEHIERKRNPPPTETPPHAASQQARGRPSQARQAADRAQEFAEAERRRAGGE